MLTKVFKVELYLIDHEGLGKDDIIVEIENSKYFSPTVMSIKSREIEYSDAHPLNHRDKCQAEYERLFGESNTTNP